MYQLTRVSPEYKRVNVMEMVQLLGLSKSDAEDALKRTVAEAQEAQDWKQVRLLLQAIADLQAK